MWEKTARLSSEALTLILAASKSYHTFSLDPDSSYRNYLELPAHIRMAVDVVVLNNEYNAAAHVRYIYMQEGVAYVPAYLVLAEPQQGFYGGRWYLAHNALQEQLAKYVFEIVGNRLDRRTRAYFEAWQWLVYSTCTALFVLGLFEAPIVCLFSGLWAFATFLGTFLTRRRLRQALSIEREKNVYKFPVRHSRSA